MELRTFVTLSLYQIAWGINDAQEECDDSECEVSFMKKNASKTNETEMKDEYHNINFNVAVMADEQSDPAQGKLLVMGIAHLGMGTYEQLLLLVSRIEFTVPMSIIPTGKKEPTFLRSNRYFNLNH